MKPKDLYTAICNQEKSIPVFLQSWWLEAVCEKWNVAISLKGDEITGVWPYQISERFSITMMRNPRLTPYLGPFIFFPAGLKQANKDSYEAEAITNLLEQLPDADMWMLSLLPGLKQAGLFRQQNLQILVQQTFLFSLQDSEEDIYANFKYAHRRNIRLAAESVEISNDPSQLPLLFEFQQQTLQTKRVKNPNTIDHFKKLMNACILNDAGTLWVAKVGGKTEALLWQVWDSKKSYYFMGAKNSNSDNSTVLTALLWHAIKFSKAKGHEVFDFEGSMDLGVERFFRHFGGTRELYMVLKKENHWLYKIAKVIKSGFRK